MQVNAHREFLTEIEHEITVLTEKLRQLQAVAAYHASKLGGELVNGHSSNGSAKNGSFQPRLAISNFLEPPSATTRFKNANQREAAAQILRDAGRNMRAGDIARILIQGGYPKPSKLGKLTNSLFTTMTRDPKRFKKVGVGMWAYVGDQPQEKEMAEEEQGR